MNTNNAVLLGFIEKASKYLKNDFAKNGQNEELTSIDELNIEELKQSVVEKVGKAFSDAKVSVEKLMQVGSDAFDEFIEKNGNAEKIINEFSELFGDTKEEVAVNKVKSDLDELLSFYEPIPEEKFVDDDDEYLKMIAEAAGKNQEQKEVQPVKEEKKQEDLDDIFTEILGHEQATPVVKEEPKEEKKISANDEYLKNLISELKSQLQEEKEKTSKVQDRVSVFEKISNLYPYLSGGFIRAVYNLKESIAKENPIGKKIVILHRIYFKDVESLRQFVEIVSNHDYTVNVDESKFVVDVFKEHINADGKILTNIFEIANQAKVLDGDYEGYRIVKRED